MSDEAVKHKSEVKYQKVSCNSESEKKKQIEMRQKKIIENGHL